MTGKYRFIQFFLTLLYSSAGFVSRKVAPNIKRREFF
jgi:hypothetical protein